MTQSKNRSDLSTFRITFIGMMAAIIFVVNYLRIPFMGTSLHLTNGLCALAGLLFGPAGGFLAAGIGSFLFDLVSGYSAQSFITLITKGMIAFVAALIGYKAAHEEKLGSREHLILLFASILGAFTYVALYMLKTFVMGRFVNGLAPDAVTVTMLSKLPGSLLNAVFASIVSPVLYNVLRPALKHSGLFIE